MYIFPKEITASFDVDPQRGFTPLCPNELPIPGGDEIVDELNRQAEFARLRVGSMDSHPADAPWVAKSPEEVRKLVDGDYKNLDLKWPAHCVVGTEGWKLLPGLPSVDQYDFMVFKGIDPLMHPYGACYHDLNSKISTGVKEFLKAKGVTHVIVGGLALNYCVYTTVLELVRAGFYVTLNLGACRAVPGDSEGSEVEKMKSMGVRIVNSARELEQ